MTLPSVVPTTASHPPPPQGFDQRSEGILTLGIPRGSSVPFRLFVFGAMLLGTGMIGASAAIHLHLWFAGYRHLPRIGPLFLAQAIAGFVLVPTILIFRRMYAVLAGALFQAATAVGLTLSATVGFLGIHDGFTAPWAMASFILEIVGFVR